MESKASLQSSATSFSARLFSATLFSATLFSATLILSVGLCAAPVAAAPAPSHSVADAEDAARRVMDDFLNAFNARDEARWADTLLFPHVRLAGGDVRVWEDRAAFLDAMDLDAFSSTTGWHRSTWDEMSIVHSSVHKVHISVTFTRFDASGDEIASYDSLYVLEAQDGQWGVRARSSFAP